MRPDLFHIPLIDYPVKSYGFMLMIGFLTGVWFAMRRAARVKADPDLILNCGFVALFAGVIGARIFYVVHYWKSNFADRSIFAALDITAGGMEAYGGLIAGVGAVLVYLLIKRASWRLYLDIGAPAAMWGLGITRIGCFLNGCCFGGLCVDEHGSKAVPWALAFPYGSGPCHKQWEERQIRLPAELIVATPTGAMLVTPEHLFASDPILHRSPYDRATIVRELDEAKAKDPKGESVRRLEKELDKFDKYADVFYARSFPSRTVEGWPESSLGEVQALARAHWSLPVHPAQLYASVNGLLIALVLSSIFYRRKHHGVVIGWMFVIYGGARVVEEIIRVDNPLDSAGLTVSQFISVAMVLLGGAYLYVVYKLLPPRSPLAVPFVPPPDAVKTMARS